MTAPADRRMARDLSRQLRGLADVVGGFMVPRWLMVVIAPSVAMVAHVVNDYARRQEEQRARQGRVLDAAGWDEA